MTRESVKKLPDKRLVLNIQGAAKAIDKKLTNVFDKHSALGYIIAISNKNIRNPHFISFINLFRHKEETSYG